MIKKGLLIIAGILIYLCSNAQNESEIPLTYQEKFYNQFNIRSLDTKNIIPQEKSNMLKEHRLNPPDGIGIGDAIHLDIDLSKEAKVCSLDNGDKIYLLKLKADMAYGLKIIFDKFIIPDSAKMFIYNTEKTTFFGPYTNKDTHHEVRFSSDDIQGDEIIIEYFEPANVSFSGQLHIFEAVYMYKNIFHNSKDGEILPCHKNIDCYPEQKKNALSVVKILSRYRDENGNYQWGFGTGFFLNTANNDEKPIVLTAIHNVATNEMDWEFYFNYNSENCSSNVPLHSDTKYRKYGNRIITDGFDKYNYDYCLVEIGNGKKICDPDFNINYAGWTNNCINAKTSSTGNFIIHHPKGNVKKISFFDRVINREDYGYKYELLDFTSGVIEKGTSGAPVFNSNNQVFGILIKGDKDITCDYIDGLAVELSKIWELDNNFRSEFAPDAFLDDEICVSNYYAYDPACSQNKTLKSATKTDYDYYNCDCFNGVLDADNSEVGIDYGPNCPGYGGGTGNGTVDCSSIAGIDPNKPKEVLGLIDDFDGITINNQKGLALICQKNHLQFGVYPKPKNYTKSELHYCNYEQNWFTINYARVDAVINHDWEFHDPYWWLFLWFTPSYTTYNYEYYIGVTKVDHNLTALEEENGEWFNIEFEESELPILIGDIDVNSALTNMGVELESGGVYKLRLACYKNVSASSGYVGGEIYIYILPDNITYNLTNLEGNYYGHSINLDNSYSTESASVIASEEINIRYSGEYSGEFTAKIDPSLNNYLCDTKSSKVRLKAYEKYRDTVLNSIGYVENGLISHNKKVSALSDCSCNNVKRVEGKNKVNNNKVISSVDELLSEGFSIYPNPVSSELNVNIYDSQNSFIEIFNLEGKLIESTETSRFENKIDVEKYNQGIYILKITTSSKSIITKFIKE